MFTDLPAGLRRSLTWDRARSSAHAHLTGTLAMPVYLCQPHGPWQRGSNENMNGPIRDGFPEGTDLPAHTAERLAESLPVQAESVAYVAAAAHGLDVSIDTFTHVADWAAAGVLLAELCQSAPSVSIAANTSGSRSSTPTAGGPAGRSPAAAGRETGPLTYWHDMVGREHVALTTAHRRLTAPLPEPARPD